MSTTNDNFHGTSERLDVSPAAKDIDEPTEEDAAKSTLKRTTTTTTCKESSLNDNNQCCAQVVLCRRFKDSTGLFRNFNSLPLFVYATSQSTHAISADGVGVSREAAASVIGVAVEKNDIDDLIRCSANATKHCNSDGVSCVIINAMECLPLGGNNAGGTTGLIGSTHAHNLMLPSINGGNSTVVNGANVANGNHDTTTTTTTYQRHLNLNHPLNHQHQHQHHHLLMSHHSATTPYSNNYPLQHSSSSHHHIHSDQTKSLQELQHEVGALLEFRDLVIETFPDLKNKMVSMSSSTSATSSGATGGVGGNSGGGSGGGGSNSVNGQSVSGTNTLTGGISSSSLASRREWEPGIRTKRKSSQKEQPTNVTSSTTGSSNNVLATNNAAAGAGELSSSSLTRSRSNSHSGKKEPKSGGENNGSVVQDSGFSTETSSSKEGHSASSTNGAMTGPNATNRLSCHETDDELLNLLDVIHRKSNRLREEVEQLQNYERTQLHGGSGGGGGGEIEETDHHTTSTVSTATTAITTKSCTGSSGLSGLTPKTFREHVERLNKEDIKQLRKERDRLLDKLAEMEAETLTGRIKAAKMNDQVEELMSVKKDLEEQLKLAMAQKLELSSRVQQLQQQQQHQQQPQQSKSSSSQSEYSSQRNFSSSATTVLSTVDSGALLQQQQRRQNTFQPVVVIPSQCDETSSSSSSNAQNAFRQSATGSDISNKHEQQQFATQPLGRLDGIVSSPGTRNSKCRDPVDSKRFAAILLETSVIELQRQLLRLTVQNQALSQKLEQSTKSKSNLVKRLDKSKEDVDDLRFQLEEKCIELEGTKAQLRVLESRIHSSTPHSTATTNSTPSYLLHSQNDYETNRSSASTTLMLSRRGIGNDSTSHSSDAHRSSTPSTAIAMPPPTSTQISTPSMKAMTHLPIDEMQQHSSSTESAHDNDLPSGEERAASRLIMSTSVGGGGGGVSAGSFEKRDLNATRRYLTSTKPSKIPLPGSKTMSYFGGKPPSGRPSTGNSNNTSHHNSGRSPNSSTTNMSSASSRSSLSRSTGNLLYSKSPNSLKRADSAQSITKAINISNLSSGNVTIPSTTRILQNSPLPKPKRDSITSRLRNIESVSRSTQQHQQNDSHNTTPNTTPRGGAKTPPSSNLVTSTPKSGAIASQLNSTLRKDLQLNSSNISHGSQQFLRRATGGGAVSTTTPTTTTTTNHNTSVTRRFSSASTVGIRAARNQQDQNGVNCGGHEHANSVNSGVNSDSDSGKHLISSYNKRVACNTKKIALTYNKETTKAPAAPYTIPHRLNYSNSNTQTVVAPIFHDCINPYFTIYANKKCDLISNSLTGISTVYEQQNEFDEEICTTPIMNDVVNSLTSMEQGSDNLLVTFDYGYSDSFDNLNSMERDFDMSSKKFINMEDCFYDLQHDKNTETESIHLKANESLNEINEYESNLSEDMWYAIQRPQSQDSVENMAKAFQVHHMEYDDVLRNENGESILSINSSLPEYDVDDNDDGDDDDDDGEDDDGDGDDYINYNEHNYGNDNRDIEREKKLWQNYQEPCKYETDLEEEFYDSIECS